MPAIFLNVSCCHRRSIDPWNMAMNSRNNQWNLAAEFLKTGDQICRRNSALNFRNLPVKLAGEYFCSEIRFTGKNFKIGGRFAGETRRWVSQNCRGFFYSVISFAENVNKKTLIQKLAAVFLIGDLFWRWKLPLNFKTFSLKLAGEIFSGDQSDLRVKLAGSFSNRRSDFPMKLDSDF